MSDRNTQMMDAEIIAFSVAASTTIEAGKLVAVNAAGYAVEAADTAGLIVHGRAEEKVDNSSGSNGDKTVKVRRNKAFKYANSSGNAATIANIGDNLYVEDDETVSTDGGTNSIVAGKCLGVESDGVWIVIDPDFILNQTITDLTTLVNDIRAKLKGDYILNATGLGVGSTAANVASIAFDFIINGVGYKKAAVAAGTALSGDDIPDGTYGAWRLEIGADGTVDIIEAADNATGYASAVLAVAGLPAVSADHASMGVVTASNAGAVFDPGTTELSHANVTEAYTDGDTAFEAIGAAVT